MSDSGRKSKWGWVWLVLIGMPPLIVLIGLVLFLALQVREGTITPKWKPRPVLTNEVTGLRTNR